MFKCRIVSGPKKEADASALVSALPSILVLVSVSDLRFEIGSPCRCRCRCRSWRWSWSWSRWLSVAAVVVLLLFEVCPRPDSGRHYENKQQQKNSWRKKHSHTHRKTICSIECVPILNVEQFDLKSPVKKTTMKQQARPKKPTINFWGGCCWHWLLKQTASESIMKNIAASGG